MEVQLDKLKLKKNDVLIIKGYVNDFNLNHLVKTMQYKRINNLILCLEDDITVETMTEEMLLDIAEKIKEKRKNETA